MDCPQALVAFGLVGLIAVFRSLQQRLRVRHLSAASTRLQCRVRESGMPPVDYWESLLSPEETLDRLGLEPGRHSQVVELGCGYGTFSLAVAARVDRLKSFDIDAGMVGFTLQRAAAAGVSNLEVEERDVVACGYGVGGDTDAALLMNILHCEQPVQMLRDAAELLRPKGLIYATHWRFDSSTPRGPPMAIRPRPEQIKDWALATGLLRVARGPVDCPPWHYGWVFEKI